MMKGPEGRSVPCDDSVTGVFHEARVRECSPWPLGLGLAGEALPQEAKQPCPAAALMAACLHVCVCVHSSATAAILLGGAKEQLFKKASSVLTLSKIITQVTNFILNPIITLLCSW